MDGKELYSYTAECNHVKTTAMWHKCNAPQGKISHYKHKFTEFIYD